MRNKRGTFFMLYLVFWTLLMCGTVMMLYHIQEKEISTSLVSPVAVLNVSDGLTIFEMQEVSLIKESLKNADGKFGTSTFSDNFRNNFLKSFASNSEMTGFILKNLTWKGTVMETKFGFDSSSFYKNILYPASGMKMDSGKLIFLRTAVGKKISLSALGVTKVNFPVDFNFEFKRKYIITKLDGKFNVEAA